MPRLYLPMRVFYGFDELPVFKNPVVTMGSYDGVHAGHRELLGRIVRLADERGMESVVITFSPHPRQVLEDNTSLKLLNSLSEKTLLLERAGVDNLIVVPFTREFSRVSSHDFVRDYLVGKVRVATLVVGYNHHFGRNQSGNYDYLKQLQAEFKFDIYMVPRQQVGSDGVSSTVIRRLIERGDMERAERYLGYPYFVMVQYSGEIVCDESAKLLPPEGQYMVEVEGAKGRWSDTLRIDHKGTMWLDAAANLEEKEHFIIIFSPQ